MNNWSGIGRLTRNPELRYTASTQMAVVSFTIAIDRPAKAGGEKQTDFIPVKVFGKQAENCEKYLAKGRLVGVEGRIQTGSYEGKKGTVYTMDVVADRVQFLEWGDNKPTTQSAPMNADPTPTGFSAIDDDIPF